jgi:hypothetical protein
MFCVSAGVAAACCFNVRPKQIEVMRDALRSADAYFRLTQAQAVGASAPAKPLARAPRSTRPLPPPAAGAPPTMFATSTLVDGMASYEEEGEEQQELAATSSSQAAADAFRMVSMVSGAAYLHTRSQLQRRHPRLQLIAVAAGMACTLSFCACIHLPCACITCHGRLVKA